MSNLNRADLNDKYNNASTGRFKTGQSKGIGSDDHREMMDDIRDSLFNLIDHKFSGAAGTLPGVNTITDLKTIITTDKVTGIQITFRDTANGDLLRLYELVSGTDAEVSPGVIRPNDYATTTNERVWKLAISGGSTDGSSQYAATSGTNTYTATITPAPIAYVTGQAFNLKFVNGNTGAATINLNGLGAKSIVKNISTALVSGDISANQIVPVFYDGTNFVILSKTNYATFAELVISGQSGTGYRFTIMDSTGKLLRAGELEYDPTTGEITFNAPDDLSTTYLVKMYNNSGDLIARFSAGKFMELGGTEFIIQVDSSITSGNARMILNDNQAMGLITEDSTGKEYTSIRTTDGDERFNIRVKRRLDVIAGNLAPMDESQFTAVANATVSSVTLIGSIAMPTDEEVVFFEMDFYAISNAGAGGFQKIKGAIQRISGGTVQNFASQVADAIQRTAGTFTFAVAADNTGKAINLNFTQNSSGGIAYLLVVNAKWTRITEPA